MSFQNGGGEPRWILKNVIFKLRVQFRGLMCVIMQKFVVIDETVAEIWRFFKTAAIHNLGSKKNRILTVSTLLRWAMVSPDGVVPSLIVCVSASVNLPLHHKVQ